MILNKMFMQDFNIYLKKYLKYVKITLKVHLKRLKALLAPLLVGFSRFPLKAHTGKKADSPGKFWERFSNFLEKNIILLVGIFLGSIIILNIFLTLILVIKYL